jgi:PAS domain S-box-containing protein
MNPGAARPIILVVDDDPGIGRLVSRELRREGFESHWEPSGSTALAWLSHGHADLLLLDLKLPDMDGAEFIEQMAAAGKTVPFIIITGQGDERVAVQMMKRGAVDYVVKDVKFIEFVPPVVRRALGELEQKRRLEIAESGLWEREEQLRIFIKHSPVALAMFDRGMRYLHCSQRWLDDFKLPQEDLCGRSHYELFPETPERWKEIHRRGCAGEVLKCDEDCFERPDGSCQWLRWEVRPWRNRAGEVGGILIFIEDITSRKRMERELNERNAHLDALVMTAPIGLGLVDMDLRVKRSNGVLTHMADRPKQQCIGQHVSDVFPAMWPAIEHSLRRAAEGSMVLSEELSGKNPDTDQVSHWFASFYPVRVSMETIGVGIAVWDVTSKRRTDEILRQQAELLQLSHDAIIVWRVGQGIDFWNAGASKLYGYAASEIRGRRLSDILQTRYPCPWTEVEDQLRADGSWEGEVRQTTKAGQEITVSSRLQMLSRTEKSLTVLITNRDISESRRLEDALLGAIEEEQRRIGLELHDGIGQELTAIGMLNSLAQRGLEKAGQLEAKNLIELGKMITRAASEVRRISHGLQPLAAEPGALAAGLAQLTEQCMAGQCVQALFECPEPVIIEDATLANHLFRIAQEAVQNALRHGEPRHLTVRLRQEESRVRLEIQDDGHGMPGKSKRTRAPGIGLQTMKYRAHAIGGFLQILRPQGGGTLIRCVAPLPPVRSKKRKAGAQRRAGVIHLH